jgi:hypothetical protein
MKPTKQQPNSSTAGKLAAAPLSEVSTQAVQPLGTATTNSKKAPSNSSEAPAVPNKEQQQQQQVHHVLDDFRLAAASLMSGTSSSSSQPVQHSSWGAIPLMDIPRIVKALAVAPPPPPPAAAVAPANGSSKGKGMANGGQEGSAVPAPMRPQTKARFRRVIQQTQQAMALLEKSMAAAAVAADGEGQEASGVHTV